MKSIQCFLNVLFVICENCFKIYHLYFLIYSESSNWFKKRDVLVTNFIICSGNHLSFILFFIHIRLILSLHNNNIEILEIDINLKRIFSFSFWFWDENNWKNNKYFEILYIVLLSIFSKYVLKNFNFVLKFCIKTQI